MITIFQSGVIPNIVKLGLLSPIFKNKGYITEVKIHRGMTVLPVFCKIIESILTIRMRPIYDTAQCSLQRGFTQNSAPINAAFIMEEAGRETNDL